MKKYNIHHFMMIIIPLIQIALGVFLIFLSLYMDEYYYLNLDSFFFFFCLVPGATLTIMGLHYLLYRKYDKKNNFVFNGFVCSFIICNTGECLILLNSMFPAGWINYVVWFILTGLVFAAVTVVFHLFFVLAHKRAISINE